jgi:hypothetical protein
MLFFGGADNPLRHLGALGLFFLWILVASGLYLYTVLDTSIEGSTARSAGSRDEQWYLGGVLRSLHRYASDGFVLVMMLHLLREWAYGRYHGFRLYSWVTGVPLIWLAYISGHRRLLDRLGPAGAVLGHRDDRTARLAADLQRTLGAQFPRPRIRSTTASSPCWSSSTSACRCC